jgi:hypothetical protein
MWKGLDGTSHHQNIFEQNYTYQKIANCQISIRARNLIDEAWKYKEDCRQHKADSHTY